MKFLAALSFAALSIAPAAANDSLRSLSYLVGTWKCTYDAGKTRMVYTATFAYVMDENWVRESDSWSGGGSDLGMFTYDSKRREWTALVIEPERSSVVFRAAGSDAYHIVYRSVYPDTSMTDVFDRESPSRYTLHFAQSAGGKVTRSNDTCRKQ